MKHRLETPFTSENVNKNVEIVNSWPFISRWKFSKIATFAVPFWFLVTKQSLEMVLASPNDQNYPRYRLVLKSNGTLARPLRLVIL